AGPTPRSPPPSFTTASSASQRPSVTSPARESPCGSDMRVLAIDTSHATGSVALVVAGETPWSCEVVASASARVSNAHGESLLPPGGAPLKNARSSMSDVDLVAVGVGPGSFTGTRVGVATAKGLALGARKPLRGVEGFDALAAGARAPVGAE